MSAMRILTNNNLPLESRATDLVLSSCGPHASDRRKIVESSPSHIAELRTLSSVTMQAAPQYARRHDVAPAGEPKGKLSA